MHGRPALVAWVLAFGTAAAVLAGCSASDPPTSATSATGKVHTTTPRPTTTARQYPASPSSSSSSTSSSTSTSTSTSTSSTAPVASKWSEQLLLAQLLMVAGSYDDLAGSAGVVSAGAGGLVLVGEPAAGDGAAITSGLAALQRSAPVPVLTSTDEEGGGVARLVNIVGDLPSPRSMATHWTPAQVTARVESVAAQMRALGLNMDLAPVVDTASAGDPIDDESERSFSENGSTASTYSLAFLRGLEAGGVAGVVKHFPGLGHADGDTDTGPATDPPLARLVGDDLVPFRAAIAAGAPVVMMSNVVEPDWGRLPASLNPAAYAYLRHLGFSGMVLTDALDAGAIRATGTDPSTAAVDAIEAGADMVILGTPAEFSGALTALESAVASGRLPMSRVIADVDRVVAVKNSVLPAAQAVTPPG